jgi:8-oxo-dGTP pyrophosphatase MutT (NUDIX family)
VSRFRIDQPHLAPVVAFGQHRGDPVDAAELSLPALRRRFRSPPDWTPEAIEDRVLPPGTPERPAAVLIPLLTRGEGLAMLLTRRSESLAQHRGQIAFPGGRIDPLDASAQAAALRETHEEIGIAPGQVEILGMLPRYRTGTGYVVTPVVGHVEPAPDLGSLRIEPGEVAEVFEVPLGFLMDPANHERRSIVLPDESGEPDDPGNRDARIRSRSFYSMPWRPADGRDAEYFIWGATAAMLRNFYRFLAAASGAR